MAAKWVPVIHSSRCTGCARCVEACGPACLEMKDGIAALTVPNVCGSEEHCIPACRDNAIEMQWVETEGARSIGKWR